MNQKAIKVLEYSKIIAALAAQAGSEMTREAIMELKPLSDARLIREALEETDEAAKLIVFKGPLPLGNFYDIGDHISRASKGGSLTMRQLLQVHYNISTARSVISFLKGDLPDLPTLREMIEVLEIFPELEKDIDRCIISEDEMSDNASTDLKNIRRAIVRQNETLKNRIEHIINSAGNRTILQDAIVTMRDGRYVIPVKVEHRSSVPGIVHDQSSSGATLFIEPQVIVELNNELRELEVQERAEVERILADLSGRVAEHGEQLRNNQALMVRLDMINARGKLASLQKAECPSINEDGILELKEARHPLIDPKKVVPINVRIGDDYQVLIITGPNTGGKTVTLKTCGLLAMMAQTGLHIPASSGSRIPVYSDIFADIGDEQSIEQSLSTFSSHMRNIVDVTAKAGPDTLVLLDELGAGTDPTEGAALAISILEELAAAGASVVATTHYNELKKYALSTDGVENASMEFNVETLSPTYRLNVGTPGRSNAFEISTKLGLNEKIIDRARNLMEGSELEFEDVIASIEENRKAAEAERMEAERLGREMNEQREALKKEARLIEEKNQQMINDAKARARGIISEAREVSSEVQEELRQLSKIDSLGERNKKFDKNRRRIKDAAGRYRETFIKEVNDRPVDVSEIKIGDRVKVLSLGQNGDIISLPDDKGMLVVQVGMLKVRVNADDLKLIMEGRMKSIGRQQEKSGGGYGAMFKYKAQSVSPSIDVRGKNLDDAAADVDKYLDDAYVGGMGEVTIIHGRGEGILQKGIRQRLKRNKHVDEFRKGGYNEGGDGVTIVKLKKD